MAFFYVSGFRFHFFQQQKNCERKKTYTSNDIIQKSGSRLFLSLKITRVANRSFYMLRKIYIQIQDLLGFCLCIEVLMECTVSKGVATQCHIQIRNFHLPFTTFVWHWKCERGFVVVAAVFCHLFETVCRVETVWYS